MSDSQLTAERIAELKRLAETPLDSDDGFFSWVKVLKLLDHATVLSLLARAEAADAAERELAELREQRRRWCEDSAADHTHLVGVCLAAGIDRAKVEGDQYGVPGVMELAGMLADELAACRAERGRAYAWAAQLVRGYADNNLTALEMRVLANLIAAGPPVAAAVYPAYVPVGD